MLKFQAYFSSYVCIKLPRKLKGVIFVFSLIRSLYLAWKKLLLENFRGIDISVSFQLTAGNPLSLSSFWGISETPECERDISHTLWHVGKCNWDTSYEVIIDFCVALILFLSSSLPWFWQNTNAGICYTNMFVSIMEIFIWQVWYLWIISFSPQLFLLLICWKLYSQYSCRSGCLGTLYITKLD